MQSELIEKLRTVIIDDESDAIENLEMYLEKHLSEKIELVGNAQTVPDGIELIRQQKPELVFLDVEIGRQTGFDLLSQLGQQNFKVIFVTGYAKYAIKAIRYAALDYLVKPIDLQELMQAVDRVNTDRSEVLERWSLAKDGLNQKAIEKIALPDQQGFTFVKIDEICAIKAEGSYSKVLLQSNEEILVSRIIKEFEQLLPKDQFVRIHRSTIVNLHQIRKFTKTDGGMVEMNNGAQFYISANRKNELMDRFGSL